MHVIAKGSEMCTNSSGVSGVRGALQGTATGTANKFQVQARCTRRFDQSEAANDTQATQIGKVVRVQRRSKPPEEVKIALW